MLELPIREAAREDKSLGLRDRKKAEARAAIVRAALELFGRHGYGDVTVDQIAERAGVARRTYFRYFPTKESVVLDRRMDQLERFRRAMQAAPSGAPAKVVVEAALTTLADEYRAGRDRILAERALFASSPELAARDLAIDRAFEETIAEVVSERSGRTGTAKRSARFFAAAAMGVLRVLLEDWAEGEGDLDLVKVGLPALETISALAPEKASSSARGARR